MISLANTTVKRIITIELINRSIDMARPAVNAMDRFVPKFNIVESGCHEWNAALHRDGYGKFYFRGKDVASHRASYILNVGEVPEGLMVLHKCDNRKCVNPNHLYIGTAKQNVKDMHERTSWYGNMKYTRETVDECFRLYYEEGLTQTEIAKRLGMSQTNVSKYLLKKLRKLF